MPNRVSRALLCRHQSQRVWATTFFAISLGSTIVSEDVSQSSMLRSTSRRSESLIKQTSERDYRSHTQHLLRRRNKDAELNTSHSHTTPVRCLSLIGDEGYWICDGKSLRWAFASTPDKITPACGREITSDVSAFYIRNEVAKTLQWNL